MAVPFATIEPEVKRLRDFIFGDLRALFSQDLGGCYLAAALITCSCERLANLKYGKEDRGELFFAELLAEEHKPIAGSLYNAIRNGIVHLYDTQMLCIGARKLEIVISWGRMPHLHLSPDGRQIYVNVRSLEAELKSAFTRYEEQLRRGPALREVFATRMVRGREFWVNEADLAAWEKCLPAMKRLPEGA